LKIISIILIVAGILLLIYRFDYGTWDPRQIPPKLVCYARTYNKSITPPQLLTGNDKPTHLVIFSLNILTGKRVYLTQRKGRNVPTVIYLYLGNGKYQSYSLSGGP
ncbi:MAG: hypothetical protein ACYCX4_15915, partial [Bacillota bacterium]